MLVHGYVGCWLVLLLTLSAVARGSPGSAAESCGVESCRGGAHKAPILLQTKALSHKIDLSDHWEEEDTHPQAPQHTGKVYSHLPEECWMLPEKGTDNVKVSHKRSLLSARCPLPCPFSQRLTGDPCFKACVPGGPHGCSQLHPLRVFPNPVTHSCEEPCGTNANDVVVGCAECAGVGRCRRCMLGYSLQDDGRRCENKLQIVWQVVYVLIGITLSCMATYALTLFCRPVVNQPMVEHAELHQELCRPWMLDTSGDTDAGTRHKYSLLRTQVHEKDISGLGVLLYFRWLRFVFFVGLVLLVATACAWFIALSPVDSTALGDIHKSRMRRLTIHAQACPNATELAQIDSFADQEMMSTQEFEFAAMDGSFLELLWKPRTRKGAGGNTRGRATGKSDGEPQDMERPAGDPRKYPERMFLVLTSAYGVIFFSSLAFASHQARLKTRRDDLHLLHGDYVLRVDGLPSNATDSTALVSFFQEILDEAAAGVDRSKSRLYKIEGVSIAYKFCEHQEVIYAALNSLVEEVEAEYPCMDVLRDPSFNRDGDAAAGSEKGSAAGGFTHRLQAPCRLLDKLLVPDIKLRPNKQWREQVRPVLESLEGSGTAYIITSSKLAAQRLLLLQGARCWSGEELSFRVQRCEPPDVLWGNIGKKVTWWTVASSVRLMVLTILGWVLFYVPYAMHYTDLARAPQEQTTFTQDIVLGLLISFGNQMVGAASDAAADNCAFIEKDRRDVVVMALAFVSTFANTVCDLGMVFILAHGIELDSAVMGNMLDSGYDRALARELMSLLVPGYLIIPHVMAPIFEYIIPTYAARLIIRSTPGVARGVAEQALMCPDFDINWRYVDVLTNFMVCFMMLFFATPNTWRIMVFLLFFVVLIYLMDIYKLLRQTSQTFYTTDALSVAFTYCWCLPTACLAGAAAWWGSRTGVLAPSEYVAVWLAVPLHCIVYVFAVSLAFAVVPAPHGQTDLPYKEMCNIMRQQGKAYDFFNTNPAHVLREYLLQECEPCLSELNCIPYARGKDYLQMNLRELMRSKSLGSSAAEVLGSLACRARLAVKPAPGRSVNHLMDKWRHSAHRMGTVMRTIDHMQAKN